MAVVIGMAILAILTAAVAPAVYVIMQEDREQELIFRGRQYVRGISLFQRRFGRYPNTLKEMYESQPRTVRKLWKEPICDCDDWVPIILGTPGAQVGVPVPGTTAPAATPTAAPTSSPFGQGVTKIVGPIIGVRSNVKKKSLGTWRGQTSYDQWQFILGDADRPDVGGGQQMPPGLPGPLPPTAAPR